MEVSSIVNHFLIEIFGGSHLEWLIYCRRVKNISRLALWIITWSILKRPHLNYKGKRHFQINPFDFSPSKASYCTKFKFNRRYKNADIVRTDLDKADLEKADTHGVKPYFPFRAAHLDCSACPQENRCVTRTKKHVCEGLCLKCT